MSARIADTFTRCRSEGRAALVCFVTGGDPSPEATPAILDALVAGGADLIELGLPFTDPMADGPAIQRANLRALAAGATTARLMEIAAGFRARHPTVPLVLMGYANPMLRRGAEAFAADCARAGIDGVICVDVPAEQDASLGAPLRAVDVAMIRLATPTTDAARLPAVLAGASGFLYYVAVAGITGMQQAAQASIEAAVARLKAATDLPIAVGFGVRTPAQAAEIGRVADGVVVGSAIIDAIADAAEQRSDPAEEARIVVSGLAAALRATEKESAMSWLDKVRNSLPFVQKRETPDNLWHKCPGCGTMVFNKEYEDNQSVCPKCDFHGRIGPDARFDALFDNGVYVPLPSPTVREDPLKFRDSKKYADRLRAARGATGEQDALINASGKIEGFKAIVGVQDFAFMGGSMGLAVGAAFIAGIEAAIADLCPYIIFTAAGGARMQEGILSLMQMPKTTVGIQRLHEAGLPYIVVMTDPTTGGVTASYAMLGDIQIAEPGALIGFAGQRVIEQTIREKLPEGFQRAEYLLDHGMLDMVVHRHKLRAELARLIAYLAPAQAA